MWCKKTMVTECDGCGDCRKENHIEKCFECAHYIPIALHCEMSHAVDELDHECEDFEEVE